VAGESRRPSDEWLTWWRTLRPPRITDLGSSFPGRVTPRAAARQGQCKPRVHVTDPKRYIDESGVCAVVGHV